MLGDQLAILIKGAAIAAVSLAARSGRTSADDSAVSLRLRCRRACRTPRYELESHDIERHVSGHLALIAGVNGTVEHNVYWLM